MKKSFVILALLLAFSMLFSACTEGTVEVSTVHSDFVCVFVINQVNEDQKLNVSYSSDETIEKLEITVKHGEQVVSNNVFEGEALKNSNVDVDAYYGKHTVNIRATSENGGIAEVFKEVALSASEYVIAPISGSMPQLYFTLNMKEITNDHQIPAFVWLARPDSWNWDKLPENVYAMPNAPIEEVLTHNNYDKMVEATDAYIEELYSINSGSKFNLYINDYNSYLYLKLLAGNGIPESNYYVTLLSDGGASYADFNKAFNIEEEGFDADAKYAEMAEKLNTLYTEVREAKDYNGESSFSVDGETFRQYSFVAAKEMNNVEWWILRPRAGVLCSPDEEFINMVLNDDKKEGVMEERNFANPLKGMTDDEKAALKSLYNFNNEMFEAADEANKKAMMILGSWAYAENEPDFNDYVNLVKAYYGEEEFVYYYKGHPNTPTSNHPDKQDQLDELDLIDVESSINAELILFFYPDIYMCGYNSSTFMSVESPEMACAMFNMTYEQAKANEGTEGYRELIGIYLSKITEESAYAKHCDLEEGNFYLVEFNNEKSNAAYGIYNAEENTFKYYTAEGAETTK